MPPWRERDDRDALESYGEKLTWPACALVEAWRHAQRVGKVEAEPRLRQPLVVRPRCARVKSKLKPFDRQVVSLLRWNREKERLAKAVQPIHGRTRAG